MPVLANAQHEALAQAVASGEEETTAYMRLYPRSSKRSAKSHAPRLLVAGGIVRARVKELQAASATATTLTMQERREFLARVVRVDMTALDKERDGVLVQEITETVTTQKDGRSTTRTTVKVPGKRDCIELDARLAGELTEKVAMDVRSPVTPEQVLAAVRKSPALVGLGKS